MTIRIAYDDNLGCPGTVLDDAGFEAVSFHDIGAMLDAFIAGDVVACFSPAGSLPYLDGVDYVLLAQAEVGTSRVLHSRMCVPVSSPAASADDVLAVRIGAINPFCTTSYWAPMIELMEHVAPGATLSFVQANGFDDLLAGVVGGRFDAAMVWDQVLARHPEQASRVREVFVRDGLPAPLVFGRSDLPVAQREAIATAFITSPLAGPPAYFDLFGPPDVDGVAEYGRQLAAVQAHFAAEPITP